ncbi:MAG: universal stress [Desulfobulbaceae bacterium]|jgi:nucleotide-binding universal stress UspA family protein|nr:MAG: universal stress [Desulfobulbaceae bacterium]MBV5329086.1 universal stress protein [Chlorobium sp.]
MKILVAHDGSAHASKALEEAGRMAILMGAEMTIVTVAPDLCLSDEVSDSECKLITESIYSQAEGDMKKVTAELATKGIKAEIVIKDGHPAEKIIDTAKEIGADLIVVGCHGRHGAKRFFLGSISSKIVEHAACHVLVIK